MLRDFCSPLAGPLGGELPVAWTICGVGGSKLLQAGTPADAPGAVYHFHTCTHVQEIEAAYHEMHDRLESRVLDTEAKHGALEVKH